VAVDGVDLDVRHGEIHGLIGPDGAGKSSLMKAIAGVLTFDAGDVHVLGVPLDSEAACERIKDRIGFMPQGLGLNLYADLTVEENIDFFARLRLVGAKDLAARKSKLLAVTRLDRFKHRLMKELSGGMKQKLGLACTLVHQPELIVLDEPTTGVDPVSRRDFWAILVDLLQEQRTTALVSTAYMDEASRFHRIALMLGGRVIASGEPDEIEKLVPGRVVSLHTTNQVAAFTQLKTRFPQVQALGSSLQTFVEALDAAGAQRAVEEATTGIVIDDLRVTEPDLEDVFIALSRRDRSTNSQRVQTPSAMPVSRQVWTDGCHRRGRSHV
jgi:ABC-2 type transport system ATP-binding protein